MKYSSWILLPVGEKKRDTTEISSNSRPHTPKDPVTELKGPGEFKGAELCGYEL